MDERRKEIEKLEREGKKVVKFNEEEESKKVMSTEE